jgi:hypothetical protein
MNSTKLEWAGVPFVAVHHHDGRFFRQPGLFGFVARAGEERTLLYVGDAENIAGACRSARLLSDALTLGLNELHLALHVVERIDRLLLKGHIIRRCEPLLNVLDDAQAGNVGAPVRFRTNLM